MIELKTCKNFGCRNKFKVKIGQKYCSTKCGVTNHNNIHRVHKLVMARIEIETVSRALRDWKPEKINHYYMLAVERSRMTQTVLTGKMKDKDKILPEEYLIKSPFFYLPEEDRIQSVTSNSPTIKEYLESLNN